MTHATCRQARDLIHAQLDGELGPGGQQALAAHLEVCTECVAFAQGLGSVDDAVREEVAAVEPPASFVAHLQQHLAATRATRRRAWPSYAWALAAAVGTLAICLTVLLRVRSHPAAVVTGAAADLHLFASGSTVSRTVGPNQPLEEQDVLWGTDGPRASLRFADGARVELSGDAVVRIERRSVTICKGSLWADLSASAGQFSVITQWGTLESEGGVFALERLPDQDSARLSVARGSVKFAGSGHQRTFLAGESMVLRSTGTTTLTL